jgi:hypothetical protein
VKPMLTLLSDEVAASLSEVLQAATN